MQYPYGHSQHHGNTAHRVRAPRQHWTWNMPEMPPMSRVGKPAIISPAA